MGKRGPIPKRSDGFHITAAGYLRGLVNGRSKLKHVLIWEKENGPVPSGHFIHHINRDPLDNRIENLALVTPTEHRRIHGGCKLVDGEWWKPCSICKEMKPITKDHWYISKEGWPLYGRCKTCHIKIVVQKKRLRRIMKKNNRG